MSSIEREQALDSLIRSLQQDADLEVEMWREVGNAIMQYTNSKRVLLSKLSKVFVALEEPAKPIKSQPLPSMPPSMPTMPYPAYRNPGDPEPVIPASYPGPGGYPSSSSQSPWPPDLVPRATVPQRPPQQMPPPAPNGAGQQQPWSLKSALAAASRGAQQ